MSDIRSPLGNRSFSATGPQVFAVDDPTVPQAHSHPSPGISNFQEGEEKVYQGDEARQIREQLFANSMNSKKIAPTAKSRIELLMGLGRVTEVVEVAGCNFTLQSLKSKEDTDVFENLAKLAPEVQTQVVLGLHLQKHVLSKALTHVDGQPLELVIGSTDHLVKLALLEGMETEVVSELYQKYLQMKEKNKKKLQVVDEKDAKALGDDLKK